MPLQTLQTKTNDGPRPPPNRDTSPPEPLLLSPAGHHYDGGSDDLVSPTPRSDQDSDSDDDQRQAMARNSRELRAHDRLVLMEEEETDLLVAEERRRRHRESQRRSSGLMPLPLPLPLNLPLNQQLNPLNPLRLLVRRYSDTSLGQRARSPGVDSVDSASAGVDSAEKKQARRAKRARRVAAKKQEKKKLRHGGEEDGEQLLHEMEQGGIRAGSYYSTGDSSDRGEEGSEDGHGHRHDEEEDDENGRNSSVEGKSLLGPYQTTEPKWKQNKKKSHKTRHHHHHHHGESDGDGGGGGGRRGGRKCLPLLLTNTLIIVAFALLALVAWKLSEGRHHRSRPTDNSNNNNDDSNSNINLSEPVLLSNGSELFLPTTILISLDGFRADFLQRGLTPRLQAFIGEGVSPPFMLPSFPSVTFPNHYTIATGLFPESHGVVGNTFWDPALREQFYYTDPARSMDAKWWRQGEPFWVTAERAGVKTAIHMWPGSESPGLGVDDEKGEDNSPSYVDRYNGDEALPRKVARVLEFLDMPRPQRPQIVAAYVPNVDADGHRFGPNSTEIRATISAADAMLDSIFAGLEERNLTGVVNIIVVSDHGMATTDISRLVQLESLVDLDRVAHLDGWPLVGLRPKDPADLLSLHEQVVDRARAYPEAVDVYLRDVDMPERYHFASNERIAPLWIVPRTGWALVSRDEIDLDEVQRQQEEGDGTGEPPVVYHPRGLHGYDHEHPLMRAIFVARGPAFPHAPNSRLDVFQNIEVYNMLCDSVGLTPRPNNGTLRLPLKPIGLHSDPDATLGLDTPADPVTVTVSSTATATAAPTPTPPAVGGDVPVADDKTDNETETEPDAGTDGEGEGEEDEEKEDESAADSVQSAAQGFWDWLTGKIGELWDKVAGSKSGDEDAATGEGDEDVVVESSA